MEGSSMEARFVMIDDDIQAINGEENSGFT